MKLTTLWCHSTRVSDLSPLKDMKLTFLFVHGYAGVGPVAAEGHEADDPVVPLPAWVSDLSPLKDMKLTDLQCYFTQVSDLSPLKDMPLESLMEASTPGGTRNCSPMDSRR